MSWFRRKWKWAMQNKLFWLNIFLGAISLALIYLWPAPSESDFRVKSWGMVLQLVGVFTVWFDLTSTARTFGKIGMAERTRKWLKAGFSRDATVMLTGVSAQASASSFCRASVRWPIESAADHARRIEAVEKNIVKIDEDIGAIFRELDQQSAVARERAANEEQMRAQAIAEVRRELIEASVGNFPVLVFGAVWLAVGVVLSTWAPEIAKVAAGNWRSVLSAI